MLASITLLLVLIQERRTVQPQELIMHPTGARGLKELVAKAGRVKCLSRNVTTLCFLYLQLPGMASALSNIN